MGIRPWNGYDVANLKKANDQIKSRLGIIGPDGERCTEAEYFPPSFRAIASAEALASSLAAVLHPPDEFLGGTTGSSTPVLSGDSTLLRTEDVPLEPLNTGCPTSAVSEVENPSTVNEAKVAPKPRVDAGNTDAKAAEGKTILNRSSPKAASSQEKLTPRTPSESPKAQQPYQRAQANNGVSRQALSGQRNISGRTPSAPPRAQQPLKNAVSNQHVSRQALNGQRNISGRTPSEPPRAQQPLKNPVSNKQVSPQALKGQRNMRSPSEPPRAQQPLKNAASDQQASRSGPSAKEKMSRAPSAPSRTKQPFKTTSAKPQEPSKISPANNRFLRNDARAKGKVAPKAPSELARARQLPKTSSENTRTPPRQPVRKNNEISPSQKLPRPNNTNIGVPRETSR